APAPRSLTIRVTVGRFYSLPTRQQPGPARGRPRSCGVAVALLGARVGLVVAALVTEGVDGELVGHVRRLGLQARGDLEPVAAQGAAVVRQGDVGRAAGAGEAPPHATVRVVQRGEDGGGVGGEALAVERHLDGDRLALAGVDVELYVVGEVAGVRHLVLVGQAAHVEGRGVEERRRHAYGRARGGAEPRVHRRRDDGVAVLRRHAAVAHRHGGRLLGQHQDAHRAGQRLVDQRRVGGGPVAQAGGRGGVVARQEVRQGGGGGDGVGDAARPRDRHGAGRPLGQAGEIDAEGADGGGVEVDVRHRHGGGGAGGDGHGRAGDGGAVEAAVLVDLRGAHDVGAGREVGEGGGDGQLAPVAGGARHRHAAAGDAADVHLQGAGGGGAVAVPRPVVGRLAGGEREAEQERGAERSERSGTKRLGEHLVPPGRKL